MARNLAVQLGRRQEVIDIESKEREGLPEAEELIARLRQYVEACAAERTGAKGRTRFPNLAGFCAALGVGVDAFEREMEAYPEIYGAICAVLEDEALNWEWSATLVSAYLKKRLGYGDRSEEPRSVCEAAETRLVFEHDVFEDGG